MKARYLIYGCVITALVCTLIFAPAVVSQGPVEPPRMIQLYDSDDVFTPEQKLVLQRVIDQVVDNDRFLSERLRKVADSICCP